MKINLSSIKEPKFKIGVLTPEKNFKEFLNLLNQFGSIELITIENFNEKIQQVHCIIIPSYNNTPLFKGYIQEHDGSIKSTSVSSNGDEFRDVFYELLKDTTIPKVYFGDSGLYHLSQLGGVLQWNSRNKRVPSLLKIGNSLEHYYVFQQCQGILKVAPKHWGIHAFETDLSFESFKETNNLQDHLINPLVLKSGNDLVFLYSPEMTINFQRSIVFKLTKKTYGDYLFYKYFVNLKNICLEPELS